LESIFTLGQYQRCKREPKWLFHDAFKQVVHAESSKLIELQHGCLDLVAACQMRCRFVAKVTKFKILKNFVDGGPMRLAREAGTQ